MRRLEWMMVALLLGCQPAPAEPTSTNWQKLAKTFSTHHTAKFEWDIVGLPIAVRGIPNQDGEKYIDASPFVPIMEPKRYQVWMDLDKPWLSIQTYATKDTFPPGNRSIYMTPGSKQKPIDHMPIPPPISGPITSLLKVFSTGFRSCKVEAPALQPGTNHYGGNMLEWAKLDCKELQKGFGNPLYISYRTGPVSGPYPDVMYFETKAVKNVPSYTIRVGFSGIIWDEQFPGTVYSTKHYGDTFNRPLTPSEIVGGTYTGHQDGHWTYEKKYQNEKKKEEYYDDLKKK